MKKNFSVVAFTMKYSKSDYLQMLCFSLYLYILVALCVAVGEV